MALDARRRQKKAERRNAKQKARRKELARRNPADVAVRLARATAAPILHCCTTESLWSQGIAQVLVSRQLSSGQVAFAVFLVDRYCLGVKNALSDLTARGKYFDKIYDGVAHSSPIVPLTPADARKLVEEAVAYARDLGFAPHPDYAKAKAIFGDIDASTSQRQFEFGKDGKPLFISGPHDSPGRCQSIAGILSQRCGPGGFDYVIKLPQSPLGGAELLDFSDDLDEDEDGSDDDVIDGAAVESADEPHPALPDPHATFGAERLTDDAGGSR
jgi:hypothetical protein